MPARTISKKNVSQQTVQMPQFAARRSTQKMEAHA
jgi:hypothetical protein